MNYIIRLRAKEQTLIPTGKILPCHNCGEEVKISKPTYERVSRLEIMPLVMCVECFEKTNKEKITIANPTRKEIKAIRKIAPEFNEQHLRRIKEDLKK